MNDSEKCSTVRHDDQRSESYRDFFFFFWGGKRVISKESVRMFFFSNNYTKLIIIMEIFIWMFLRSGTACLRSKDSSFLQSVSMFFANLF